jgi:hypothetical protein
MPCISTFWSPCHGDLQPTNRWQGDQRFKNGGLSGFRYAAAIDLSMDYYHITLDLEAQKLCTIILPWGKYQCKRLPMGVKTSPGIFQRIMYELLGDIPNIQVYLDDILITSNGTFEEHAAIM